VRFRRFVIAEDLFFIVDFTLLASSLQRCGSPRVSIAAALTSSSTKPRTDLPLRPLMAAPLTSSCSVPTGAAPRTRCDSPSVTTPLHVAFFDGSEPPAFPRLFSLRPRQVHFIIRWKNPVTGLTEEKHLTNAPRPASDKLSHLYTLVVRPDATFSIKIDNKDVRSGSLGDAADFSPRILPPRQIDDPSDVKPADWVDEAQIPDPEAVVRASSRTAWWHGAAASEVPGLPLGTHVHPCPVRLQKPEDWDEDAPSTIEDADAVKPAGWLDNEAAFVLDPTAVKPEEWDDEEDGAWPPTGV
jgi:hypothetical protein